MLVHAHPRAAWLPVWSLILGGVIADGLPGARSVAAPVPPGYLIDVKNTEDGLPSSMVTAIAQTPEGYLWVGTHNGLARFDGERFVNFHPVNTPGISHARVQALFVDAVGTLWINTFRGELTSYRDGVFRKEWAGDPAWFDMRTSLVSSSSNQVTFVTQFGDVLHRLVGGRSGWIESAPPSGSRPFFQCADAEGRLWFLTRDQKILWFKDGRFSELPAEIGWADKRVNTLVADARGRVWAGAENEIALWNGGRFQTMTPTNGEERVNPVMLLPTRSGAVWVLAGERLRKLVNRAWTDEVEAWRGLLGWAAGRRMGAHEDREGGVWFNHYGNGLFHITPDGRYQRFTARDGLSGDRVGAWFQSRDGGLWLGVDRGGLVRLRERRFHVVEPAEDLPVRAALSVCEDANGAIWVGTGGNGLWRWRNGETTHFRVGDSASANFVFSMFPRPGGGIWISAGEGEDLSLFDGDRVQRAPWELHAVKSLLTDRTGRTWIGTKANLAWWSEDGRRSFGTNDGLTLSAVRALAESPGGTVWCGTDDGTLYRCEPDRLQAFRPADALAQQPVWSLFADAEGAVWVGTFWGGLLRFKDGKFSRFTAREGLPVNVISQILEDGEGRLWLGTHQGICSVSKAALNAQADGLINRVECVTYGRLDGLPALECSDGYQPACWKASDGRLWFTTIRGAVSVDPDKVEAASPPPPVLIEELRVDGEVQDLRAPKLVISPGHKQFEFRFTALSFETARFRYRIDGLDTDWVEAGTRRTAQYSHLPPKNYRLRVIACDRQGVWNGTGTSLAFTVHPYFYQTWWFIACASALVLGGVVIGVRTAAARTYQRELAALEQQHAVERDRARIAKDIHDDIGAGLTQITLLSELARRETDQTAAHLERISDSARHLTRAMDEIVWAVDPQHDTFTGLMDYISAYAEDFLRWAGIRCRMDLPVALPAVPVDAELRYNLFLAVKETLNNVVKHSGASEVWLRLRVDPQSFMLVIEDNGKGFPMNGATGPSGSTDRIASGSGVSNLNKRLESIGGLCRIDSGRERGTRVEMVVRIKAGASPIVAIGSTGPGRIGWGG